MNEGRLEQVADPETLYHRPATLFAARFVGAGSFLEGRCLARGRRRSERGRGAGSASRPPTPGCATAGPCRCCCARRTSGVVEAGQRTADRHVETSAFFGAYHELRVATPAGIIRLRDKVAHTPGSTIGIEWPDVAGIAYPGGETVAAEGAGETVADGRDGLPPARERQRPLPGDGRWPALPAPRGYGLVAHRGRLVGRCRALPGRPCGARLHGHHRQPRGALLRPGPAPHDGRHRALRGCRRTSARCVPSTWTVRPRSSGRPGSAACSCCCVPPTWATWTPTTRATKAGPKAGTTSSSRSRSGRCGTTAVESAQALAHLDNVTWVLAGDRLPGEALPHMEAMAEGIREVHRDALFTAHVHPGRRPLESFPWLGLNQVYSYGIVHRRIHDEHRLEPPRPCILFESTYENEGDSTRLQLRQQSWWALLGGACGQCFGNKPVWGAFPGWLEALDSPGAQDQARFASFLGSRPWWRLVPDVEQRFIVGGAGEHNGLDRTVAAIADDGSLALVYVPLAREIALDLTALPEGRYRATWFDPASGASRTAGTYAAAGRWSFLPPWPEDAVLELERLPTDPAEAR